jgi:hypothetical protein
MKWLELGWEWREFVGMQDILDSIIEKPQMRKKMKDKYIIVKQLPIIECWW